jgi:hypothetical protein
MRHEFSSYVFEEIQVSNFMKIRPVGVELLHVDGQVDGRRHNEANSRFSPSCERA